MSWPPGEKDWRRIAKELSPAANPEIFRVAIDAAIDIYEHDDAEAETWERIAKLSRSKSLAKLCAEINKLRSQPPSLVKKSVLGWGNALAQIVEISSFQAQFAKSRSLGREERLYSNLLIAWTRAGAGALSDSEDGPLNRVMCAILARVLADPPGPRGVRDIVRREKQRRGSSGIRRLATKIFARQTSRR